MDDGKGGDFVSLIGYTSDNLRLWHTVTEGITKGTLYRFRHRARNSIGWGPFSDYGFVLAATVPTKPPAPEYVQSSNTTIDLSFAQSNDDGGSPILGYKLFADAGNDFTSAFT